MPRLILFAPAERVLIDQQDNSVSLVNVLSGVKAQLLAPDETPPADASVPIRWSVLALWRREAGDEGKRFEQRLQMFLPDGLSAGFDSVTPPFSITGQTHRIRTDIQGFLISVPGFCKLVASLREEGQQTWSEKATYDMLVEHVQPDVAL